MKVDVEQFLKRLMAVLLTPRADCSPVTSKPAHLSPYLPDIHIIGMYACHGGPRPTLSLNADALRDFDLLSAIAVAEDGRDLAIEGVVAVGDRSFAEARVAPPDLLRNLRRVDAWPASKFAVALGLSFLFKSCAVSFQDAEQGKRLASGKADLRRASLSHTDGGLADSGEVQGVVHSWPNPSASCSNV